MGRMVSTPVDGRSISLRIARALVQFRLLVRSRNVFGGYLPAAHLGVLVDRAVSICGKRRSGDQRRRHNREYYVFYKH